MIAPQPFFRARGTPFSVLHRIRALVLLGHSVDLVTYPFGEPVPLDDDNDGLFGVDWNGCSQQDGIHRGRVEEAVIVGEALGVGQSQLLLEVSQRLL